MTTCTRAFDAPINDVWAALVEPTTYPRWLVGAKQIRAVAENWPEEGSWFEHVVGLGPLRLADRTSSLGASAPHSLVLLVRARPMMKATVSFQLSETDNGCTLTMTETPAGLYRGGAMLASPMLRRRNDRSLEHLADVVERARSWNAES